MEKQRADTAAKAAAAEKALDEQKKALEVAAQNMQQQLALQKARMEAEANTKLVAQANESFAAQLEQLQAQVSDALVEGRVGTHLVTPLLRALPRCWGRSNVPIVKIWNVSSPRTPAWSPNSAR